MSGQDICLDGLLSSLQSRRRPDFSSTAAVVAGRRVAVESDDRQVFSEFFVMFGGSPPVAGRHALPADLKLEIHASVHPQFGRFRMSARDRIPVDAREFELSVAQERGLFERAATHEADWSRLDYRGDNSLAFAFRGPDCIFSLRPQWRRGIVTYLFWRLLRIRSDAVFFHASAVGIFGEGTIFVGPPGAGKSTLSLGLAARGHDFLSDEIGGYVPERGELMPFRRPVGIRPGPRSTAVGRSLPPDVSARIERDGFARVEIDRLLTVAPARAVPLRRIVFLRGFAAQPSLKRVEPGREEVAALQPAMSSFLDGAIGRRVFEMTRLLSAAKVYRLVLGSPDDTLDQIETAFAVGC